MAPFNQYLMPDQAEEIKLARSAAPASISDSADILVLTKDGYVTGARGTNGFTCLVIRSWAKSTDDPEFWNPKISAPHCLNAPAARTYLPIVLMKTKLVLIGKSKADIHEALQHAWSKKALPALDSDAMCYMMSPQQYLSDDDKQWHPHIMWYVSGDSEKDWGSEPARRSSNRRIRPRRPHDGLHGRREPLVRRHICRALTTRLRSGLMEARNCFLIRVAVSIAFDTSSKTNVQADGTN